MSPWILKPHTLLLFRSLTSVLLLTLALAASSSVFAVDPDSPGSGPLGPPLSSPSGDESQPAPPAFAGSGYALVGTWQSRAQPPIGVILDPVDVRTGTDDTFLVTDEALHRVLRYDRAGQALAEYGKPGADDGELYLPISAAEDEKGRWVAVADHGNSRIVVFRRNGAFLRSWPVDPAPTSVAFDGGWLYVLDNRGNYITQYHPTGTKIDEVRTRGAPGYGSIPRQGDFARSTDGYLLGVLGGMLYQVQDGQTWSAGSDVGLILDVAGGHRLHRPILDVEGAVWIGNDMIQRGDLSLGVNAIERFSEDEILAAASRSGEGPPGVYRYRLSRGAFGAVEQDRWGRPITIRDWLGQPLRVDATATDALVVDALGRLLRRGPDGQGLGQAFKPGLRDAVVLANGEFVVVRELRHGTRGAAAEPHRPPAGVVRVLAQRWRFSGGLTSGPEQTIEPTVVWSRHWDRPENDQTSRMQVVGLAYDPRADSVAVLDSAGKRVLRVTPEGEVLDPIPLPEQPWGIPGYVDLAYDSRGKLHVAHSSQRLLLEVESDGAVTGRIDLPSRVARVAGNHEPGFVVVTADSWLWDIGPDLSLNSVWRGPSPPPSAERTVGPITDIDVTAGGHLMAADFDYPAIHRFSPGTGAAEVPAPSDLACDISLTAEVESERPFAGQPVQVGVFVASQCPGLPAGGRSPEVTLRDGEVRIEIGADVEVVAGSLTPPGTIEGSTLAWPIASKLEAQTYRFAVRAENPGPVQLIETMTADTLDGWYDFGTTTGSGLTATLETNPATPTPSPTSTPDPYAAITYLPDLRR